ncbi:hypothetical protein Q8G28_15450 [Lysinibacillus capsici]|uniref:hypothetical protein n=1 Tax=Lysinibacillus capsici TaxID=2115968 RepID=UPI002731BED7|nr:hypothetical protein [Lysinibacillus capsici]MDP1394780.1 hypothetical protein [Lysinibacillus capsici]MDP1415159.1 hypothetical protein [Lysinibacillus capsici]MDP1431143.1 hypothetical protein [Lysinibacillus capsici]
MRVSYKLLIGTLIISVIVGNLVYFFTKLYKIDGFDKALEGVLLFSSISLGFYGACMSVIASIFNTKAVKEIMSDKKDKREFIAVVTFTLVSGFLSVFLTIVYRVMLVNYENGGINEIYIKILSGFWSFLVLMFVSMNFLFIFISFLIFFSNKEQKTSEELTIKPQLKRDISN